MISSKKRLLTIIMVLCVVLGFGSAIFAKGNTGLTAQSAEYCYEASKSSMLYVRAYSETGKLLTTGTGFIATKDGYAVTAAHVLKKGVSYTCEMTDGKVLDASLVSSDADTDVAVLKLPKGSYKALNLTKEGPKAGSELRAMGYPMKGTLIITEGICSSPSASISGKNRMLVTCQIASGMSGGPVFNEYGQVVGMVSGTIVTMTGVGTSAMTDSLYNAVQSLNR